MAWWDTAHMDTAHGNTQNHFPAQRDTSAGLLSELLCHGQQNPSGCLATGPDTSSDFTTILNCHQVGRFTKGHGNLASHSNPASLFGCRLKCTSKDKAVNRFKCHCEAKSARQQDTSSTLDRKTLKHLLNQREKKNSCFIQQEESSYYSSLVTAK